MPESDDAPPPEEPEDLGGLNPEELFARGMQSVKMSFSGGGAQGWVPPSDEEMARLFPQYEMLGMLGRGGMGAVYKARQIELDRCVAIKLLPLEISVDRDFADRFRREARAMAKLNHPNIIAVFDFGKTGEGHLYFVMEFVEGANLHDMIHGPGVEPGQALEIIGRVCDALAFAHEQGVIHRDIKPANVMVDLRGRVKVADFGLARLTDPAAEQMGHTMTGTVMGTPDYMAPEQKRGMNVDHRADIYSLGVMLYEMLCKEVPQGIFDPPSTRVPGVDTRVDQVVIKAMNQQPDRRYQSTQEMKTDVEAARTPLPVAAPQPRLLASAPPKPRPVPRLAPPPPAPAVPRAAAVPKKNPRLLLYGGISAAIIGAAVIAIFASGKPKPAPPKPAERSDAIGTASSFASPSKEALEPRAIRLWDTPEKVPTDDKGVSWKDDALFLNGNGRVFAKLDGRDLKPRDFVFRFTFRSAREDHHPYPALLFRNTGSAEKPRHYALDLNPRDGTIDLNRKMDGKSDLIRRWKLPNPIVDEAWMRVELRAEGDAFTVSFDGKSLETVRDAMLPGPGLIVLAGKSNCYFRDIVHVPLDKPGTTPAATPAPASDDVQTFAGHRYQFIPGKFEWPTAKAKAEALGGHLATIATQGEHDWVVATFKDRLTSDHTGMWLGGSTDGTTAPWKWVTGEPFSFAAWGPGEPNGVKGGDQGEPPYFLNFFRAASYPAGFAWNDSSLTDKLWRKQNSGFLVEWDDDGTAAKSAVAVVTVATATKIAPFVNSLGMKFVPVPITGAPTGGQRVLFSIWETRVQDVETFAKETKNSELIAGIGSKARSGPDWVANWENATAFCVWLTERERKAGKLGANERYRLPSDHEWSCAVGIGDREDPAQSPAEKSKKIENVFLWGSAWPPPVGTGNFAGEEVRELVGKEDFASDGFIAGYTDAYKFQSPPGSFPANGLGLYDLDGNVPEMCEDWVDGTKRFRVMRGGSYRSSSPASLGSSRRASIAPTAGSRDKGFRVVLAPVQAQTAAPQQP